MGTVGPQKQAFVLCSLQTHIRLHISLKLPLYSVTGRVLTNSVLNLCLVLDLRMYGIVLRLIVDLFLNSDEAIHQIKNY